MALQMDGYSADTEELSVDNSSKEQENKDDDNESGVDASDEDRDPEAAAVILNKLDLNGGPPYSAKDYTSDLSEFSINESSPTSEGETSDEDYGHKKTKKIKRRKVAKTVKCSECRRMFPSKKAVERHMPVHLGTYSCSDCGKKCASAQSLKIHCKIHGDSKPFSCEECGEAFGLSIQLVTHMAKHSDGALPYACNECDKAFPIPGALKQHMRSHLERSHFCRFCENSYLTAVNLKRHMDSVHKAHTKEEENTNTRRSGRTARIDYNDEVIHVEDANVEPRRKKKHAPKDIAAAPKVKSRLRQREDDEVELVKNKRKRKKQGKILKKVNYAATGEQPSRVSSRKTKVVSYEDEESEDSAEMSDREEGSEADEIEGTPEVTQKGRDRGKGSRKRKQVANRDGGSAENEMDGRKTNLRGQGSPRKSVTFGQIGDNGAGDEGQSTPLRRGGRGKKPATPHPKIASPTSCVMKNTGDNGSDSASDDETQENSHRTAASKRRGRKPASSDESDDEGTVPLKSKSPRRVGGGASAGGNIDQDDIDVEVTPRVRGRGALRKSNTNVEKNSAAPSRVSRSSSMKNYAETEDSGVDEADSEMTPSADHSNKRGKRDVRGSSKEEGEGSGEETVGSGRGGRRGRNDSTIPPKKRMRGRH